MLKKIFLLALTASTFQVYADYKDDVGYSQLLAELGTSTPNGAGIAVSQVEAPTSAGAWIADISDSQFSSKTITGISTPPSVGTSGHATGVGRLFYGNSSSIASGINQVDAYSANHWLNSGALIAAETNRIVNHSWIGNFSTNPPSATEISQVSNILKRVDQSVEENETIQVVALNNGSSTPPPLLASAYNSIAVGRTDGIHPKGTAALDSVYTAGRIRPDIVAPQPSTSTATPVISAAAALILDQANTTNAARSEVVKATMMAGAARNTNNSTGAQINNYRANAINQTANGLDNRYGAGQVNVYNNYQIIDAGEQNSLEDGGNSTVSMVGYDYDANFGGEDSSNSSASYIFETTQAGDMELTASLVWNIDIEESSSELNATLHNLDLLLYDITGGTETLLANSNSDIDNTENIWFFLDQDRDYKLEVVAADGSSFNWDYGLAWKVTPVPLPTAVWLFFSGILGLFGISRKQSKLS